jgi:protein-S-isoprenylcysteine O-methyltransferase Ste14
LVSPEDATGSQFALPKAFNSLTLRSVIDALALLVCSVYGTIPLFWLVVHPFIGRWRKRGRHAYMWILPIWTAFIVAALILMWPFRGSHFYVNWWTWVPGVTLLLAGFSIYRSAFQGFRGVQVSGLAELEPDRHSQQLVTSGVHGWVRHPIYLAHFCEMLGWCVGTGLMPLYALLIFTTITGMVMIRIEDRELEERFGEECRRYREQVPAVIPRSFR